MRSTISKSNPEIITSFDRLQRVRIGAYERVIAEAHLARAEVLADLLLGAFEFLAKGVRALVLRPFQRFTAAFN